MIAAFHNPAGGRHRAFTLIELMLTLLVIMVITALVVPAIRSSLDGSRITQAANVIAATLSLASEKATSENRTITVRLIAGADGEYRCLQLVEIGADGVTGKALDRVVPLPDTVAIARSPSLSSFFSLTEKTAVASDPRLPKLGNNYRFREIKFRPGGRMNLDVSAKWFLTVFPVSSNTESSTPPSNFATIQLDPVNTRLTLFRP